MKKHVFLLLMIMGIQGCSTHREPWTQEQSALADNSPKANKQINEDGPPLVDRDVTSIPNAMPKVEPLSRFGNPASYEVFGSRYHVMPGSQGYQAEGVASWYGRKFHGQRTSSGEPYDMFSMTAAHRSLPLPTYAKVKNLHNGQEVIVKINDRGPFVGDRLIDLSYAAAKKLGIHATGTAKVLITAIDPIAWHKQRKASLIAKSEKLNPQKAEQKETVTLALARPKTQPAPKAAALNKHANKTKPVKNNAAPTKAKPSPQQVATASKQIYIQLGSFSKKQNAQQLANHASTLTQALSHVNINVMPDKKPNASLYKVRVGPIKNEKEAHSLHKKLLALNGASSAKLVYE